METTERESRKDRVNPARKYIRLQEIGWVFLVSVAIVLFSCCLLLCTCPMAIQIAVIHGLDLIIPQISVLMLVVSLIFFAIGYVGRQKLREQKHDNKITSKEVI